MAIEYDIAESREYEMRIYLDSMKAMYENALAQNGETYDIAFELTNKFSEISGNAVLADSRVIKALRYAVAPSISQMKLGQFLGLRSISKFENDKVTEGTLRYRELATLSDKIAAFVIENLDRRRFIWLQITS